MLNAKDASAIPASARQHPDIVLSPKLLCTDYATSRRRRQRNRCRNRFAGDVAFKEDTGRGREMARKTRKLFTIGYEQTPTKADLNALAQAGVKLVGDVCEIASSRRPGLSKNQLAAGLY